MTVDEREALKKTFEDGVAIPQTSHGNYIENYANEIYFSLRDSSLSILSVAHELFLLEMYTKKRIEVL